MKSPRHIMCDIHWGFQGLPDNSSHTFAAIRGKFGHGSLAFGGAEDFGCEDGIVGHAEDHGSYCAEDGGEGTGNGVVGALVNQGNGCFVSRCCQELPGWRFGGGDNLQLEIAIG